MYAGHYHTPVPGATIFSLFWHYIGPEVDSLYAAFRLRAAPTYACTSLTRTLPHGFRHLPCRYHSAGRFVITCPHATSTMTFLDCNLYTWYYTLTIRRPRYHHFISYLFLLLLYFLFAWVRFSISLLLILIRWRKRGKRHGLKALIK